jgi:hypothetical protein
MEDSALDQRVKGCDAPAAIVREAGDWVRNARLWKELQPQLAEFRFWAATPGATAVQSSTSAAATLTSRNL